MRKLPPKRISDMRLYVFLYNFVSIEMIDEDEDEEERLHHLSYLSAVRGIVPPQTCVPTCVKRGGQPGLCGFARSDSDARRISKCGHNPKISN
jgi:hypothetical protein